MGYHVDMLGQVRLRAVDERDLAEALRLTVLRHDGWLQEGIDIASLADLGRYVCAHITSSRDRVTFEPLDAEFDAKWSSQATAFYVSLAQWVVDGEVEAEGEDGCRWTYRYGPDGVTQIGRNGWGPDDAIATR